MAMETMAPEAPQGAGGGDVMKEAAAGILQGLEGQMAFAQALQQAGQEEPAKMLMQAGELVQAALQQIGVSGGGAPKEAPQQALGAQSPEAAGRPSARPANIGQG